MSTRRFIVVALLLAVNASFAQEKTDNVNLVQTFFQDATIAARPYGEGFFQYSDLEEGGSGIALAARAAFPIAPKFQLGGKLAFVNLSGDGESRGGITDLVASGRYKAVTGPTAIAVGGLVTLPIGDEDIGEGDLDFSFFGSLRHPASRNLVVTASFGLEFNEAGDGYINGLLFAGGVIHPLRSGLNLTGELNIRTEGMDLLSAGLDYPLRSGGRLRGAFLIGLDDKAPNFALRGGYAFGF